MKYNLDHLTQPNTKVYGPIQDDEALLLYGLIRTMGLKYIVEVGGLNGYSGRNFLQALSGYGHLYIIDPVFNDKFNIETNKNCTILKQPVENVQPSQIKIPRIDLIFFDCHEMMFQMNFYHKLVSDSKLLTDNTIIVLHDTGTHPIATYEGLKRRMCFEADSLDFVVDNLNDTLTKVSNNDSSRHGNFGWTNKHLMHEREMSNKFMELGYMPLHAHANNQDLPSYIEVRHGLTILTKPYKLLTQWEK